MQLWKKILIAVIVLFILIQFIPTDKNAGSDATSNDIATVYPMDPELKDMFQKACYDCHSNQTKYPWYSRVQPVGWWLQNHIKEGKAELNFHEFGTYTIARKYKKLEETIKEVKDGYMPMPSYLWMHPEARLTAQEKEKINIWCQALRDSIKANYPADSLVRKKTL